MLEQALITHCAPTLARLKPGGMFALAGVDGAAMEREMRSLQPPAFAQRRGADGAASLRAEHAVLPLSPLRAARDSGIGSCARLSAALRLCGLCAGSGAARPARPAARRGGFPPRNWRIPGLSAGGCDWLYPQWRAQLPAVRPLEGLFRRGRGRAQICALSQMQRGVLAPLSVRLPPVAPDGGRQTGIMKGEKTMNKVAVVYWSGTGNTQAMAEAVAQAAGAELFAADAFNGDLVENYDAIGFGCPSMGSEQLEEGEFEPMFEGCKSPSFRQKNRSVRLLWLGRRRVDAQLGGRLRRPGRDAGSRLRHLSGDPGRRSPDCLRGARQGAGRGLRGKNKARPCGCAPSAAAFGRPPFCWKDVRRGCYQACLREGKMRETDAYYYENISLAYSSADSVQAHTARGYAAHKGRVVLYKHQRWLAAQDQFLNLHPRERVDVVQRFIPDI